VTDLKTARGAVFDRVIGGNRAIGSSVIRDLGMRRGELSSRSAVFLSAAKVLSL
jgi:hypothetical protein